MAKTYAAEAIVLKRSNLGEADRLITFLSKYRGKFTSIAKGVRKVASRRGPNLELFNHVKAYFAVGKNLDVVTEVKTIHSFKGVKNSLEKIGYGLHLSEITNEFLEEGQGDNNFFELFIKALSLLEEAKSSKGINKTLRAFEMKILSSTGFRPQLFFCVKCRRPLEPERNLISPEFGGVIDHSCANGSLFTKKVSTQAIKVLRFVQEKSLDEAAKLNITDVLEKDLRDVMKFYLEYTLEKQLLSSNFSDKVRRLG